MAFKIEAAKRIQASEDEWWEGLSDTEQKDYIEDHPNSKYGQEHHQEKRSEPAKHDDNGDAEYEDNLRQRIENLEEDVADMTKEGEDASKERESLESARKELRDLQTKMRASFIAAARTVEERLKEAKEDLAFTKKNPPTLHDAFNSKVTHDSRMVKHKAQVEELEKKVARLTKEASKPKKTESAVVEAAKEDDEEVFFIADLVSASQLSTLKEVAKIVRAFNPGTTPNNICDDILKNRKFTVKGLKSDIDVLVDTMKDVSKSMIAELKDVKSKVAK